MSHQNESVKSILLALLANLGIAITKTIAAVVTKSGAMMAESIHSFADCANQGLLFWGLKASRKKPNPEHPLGYGKEIYFWSFIVALILFSMGGLFSVYEGIHKVSAHEGLRNTNVAIIVLVVSMVLESISLYGCLKQIRKVRHGESLWKWYKTSRQSELVVVLSEDIAALLGLTLALVAVILSIATGNPIYDAAGSIGIGILLVIVSCFLAVKVKGLLIGQSVDDETSNKIRKLIESRPEVEKIFNLITIQLGPQVMVAVKAKMKATDNINQLISNINACEEALTQEISTIQWVFFEPDLKD
ncbi:MAG TPA: cation diffusion facilitator family transporter [Tenuifilaceae bacterium]|nr:cation diffusion facilitator family transporter [Bacteroidales bacterium]HPA68092.1 cation diffusion facilitator family transporter [Tenuifilaceae bacterium]HPG99972.1 cation diffusion facilitator family transporter [Tenuifilaceae bacterium]HPM90214.1 cation diffusion facilitator family transporter [Tenuifilaceae bacterium]HPS04702.1 cation diffusion facilitator family transporter [Tenuifilaceae bacterium]